jgi:cell wall-associated NlpC family hydrolase
MNRRGFLVTGAAVVGAALYGGGRADAGAGTRTPASKAARTPASQAAATAIAYARARTGLPYLWGGTGPDGYDCSGLAMMAWRAGGADLPRTSQEQWAAGTRVSDPRPGDLVYFPGGDGTWQAPGHVAIVTGPGRIIQAYGVGVPIGAYPYGSASALPGTGPGDVVGYTRPRAA